MQKLLIIKKTVLWSCISILFMVLSMREGIFAQNLAPNPDFEYYEVCPENYHIAGEPLESIPWVSANLGSPDYYNTCCDNCVVDVPTNLAGFQNARSGEGYAGIYTFVPNNIREYIMAPLTSPLIAGARYYVEFYVSPAEAACNSKVIGALFTVNSPAYKGDKVLQYSPQVQVNIEYLDDYSGWTLVSGCFIANGGESYISIGNFLNDSQTLLNEKCDSIFLMDRAYYYIEDVLVTPSLTDELDLDLGAHVTACHSYTIDPGITGVQYYWEDGSTETSLTVFESGIYSLTVTEGCQIAIDSIEVKILTAIVEVEENICEGTDYDGYNTSGIYVDTFQLTSECDSIRSLHLNVVSCIPIIYYDLNGCESFMANGSHMDYSEFTPVYPSILSCANVTANNVTRLPAFANKHSCTPSINNSPAMCVTTLSSCEYIAGNAASVIIEFTIVPGFDSVVNLTGLEFIEKAPSTYNWINGPSGLNNYPKFYGIRILKNGTEIFRQKEIQTNSDWTIQNFQFIDDTSFQLKEIFTIRIELLPYCPIGNGADVSVWDIDEIRVFGGCLPDQNIKPVIQGEVFTIKGRPVQGVQMQLSNTTSFSNFEFDITNEYGSYLFDDLKIDNSYFVKGYKNDDVLNGVSVIDLIQIQRHLLGISPFTTLHQYIAADINRSGSVSAIDLLELNKLLLGVYSEFPNNTSWRFGTLPQDMYDLSPSSFREVSQMKYLNIDTLQVDFIGIKIGDLNER